MKTCKEAGTTALHAAMTARRYEQFDSFAAWKENFDRCQQSVSLAEPVLRKHRMPLAIENHKGWRAAEQAAWMNRLASGNNISLCEILLKRSNSLHHSDDVSHQGYGPSGLSRRIPALPPKQPLPMITGLSPSEQVKTEDSYNLQCVAYARQHLGL